MKKIVFSITVFLSINLSGQISIGSTNMPVAGDTLRFSSAILDSAVLFNYQNSGPNLTWIFDSLRPISQTVQTFEDPSQTVYNANSNSIGLLFADTLSLGGFSIYDAYNFLTPTSTDFSIDYRGATAPTGLSFPFPTTVKLEGSYSDKDEVFQFPLDFLDRDSSTFNFVYTNPLLGVYYGSSGYRINNVDAWGSVTTPYGTFNSIRVITDMVSFDTVSFSGQNFGINSHTREYQWISNQERIPVMKVAGQVFAGVFVPTTVEYRDSVRVVEPLFNFPPIAFFNSSTREVNLGENVHVTNRTVSITPATYNWNISPSTFTFLNGFSAISNDSIVFTPSDSGFYSIELVATNASGVDSTLFTNYIEVNGPTGIQEIDNKLANEITLAPNPVRKGRNIIISVKNDLELKSFELLNVEGKLISKSKHFNLRSVNSIAPEVKGIYFYKIITNKGIVVKKLLVE